MPFLKGARNFILYFQKARVSEKRRAFFDLSVVPFVFLILLPGYGYLATFLISGQWLNIEAQLSSIVVGFLLIIMGGWVIFMTVAALDRIGKGTPSPFLPTKKLVITGPYAYCRNPMYLGALMLIAGIGVLFHSIVFVVLGSIEPLMYLLYVRLIEEKELEKRFGKDYLNYKKRTPFIIPFIPRS